MARLWKRMSQTVRPRSVRRTPVLLCLVVFALTAVVVYGWGYESWVPVSPRPTYTATAYVVERSNKAADVRIPITVADTDRRRVEEVANARAQRYAQDHRAQWRLQAEESRLKARETVEKARRDLGENEARLETLRRQMAEAAKPQAAVEEEKAPAMVENPQWAELDRQLGVLRLRYNDMLKSRTRLHPTVQELGLRIEELQRRVANMPRQISSPSGAGVRVEGGAALKSATAGGPITEQNQKKLAELTVAVENARRASQDAEAAEKRAPAEGQTEPQYSVVDAQTIEIPPTPDYGWQRLVWTSLVAGVLMACGVGSVSTAASIEPAVGSIVEVQLAAVAPVVGTIPAEEPVLNPAKLGHRQSRLRWTLIATGLVLMIACPAAAIWGIMSI